MTSANHVNTPHGFGVAPQRADRGFGEAGSNEAMNKAYGVALTKRLRHRHVTDQTMHQKRQQADTWVVFENVQAAQCTTNRSITAH